MTRPSHISHVCRLVFFFFFQAEDGRRDSSVDWSSDVCSSDLPPHISNSPCWSSSPCLGEPPPRTAEKTSQRNREDLTRGTERRTGNKLYFRQTMLRRSRASKNTVNSG